MALETEQAHREERHAALTAVAHALTEAERVLLLGKVARRFPRLQGAQVADVLDMTTDHDMFLDQTEPFYEQFGGQLPADVPLLAVLHALILLGRPLTPGRVICLAQRAGITEAPWYPEVEVGLHVHASDLGGGPCTAGASHLLLMARAEQGMRAAGIPEHVITEFRETVRRTETPGCTRHAGDIARWVTFVDRYTEMPRRVYDPTDDLATVLHWLSMRGVDEPVRPAITNLCSHLDMRSAEAIRASLLPFYGRASE